MPSQIIHALAGRASLDAANESAVAHIGAFNLGSQGPDIFSHNRRTKPSGIAFARLLHRRDYGIFCANFARILRAEPSPLAESWFLGFVTHQVVDRVLHPYIVYRSFVASSTGIPGVPPARFHVFLERILDAMLFTFRMGRPVSLFSTVDDFVLLEPDILFLSHLIARALAATYPKDAGALEDLELRISNAFRDTLFFYRVTNPAETGMRYPVGDARRELFSGFGIDRVALLYPEFIGGEIDWLNMKHGRWLHPVSGAESFASVPDLFLAVVDAGKTAISHARGVLDGKLSVDEFAVAIGNECLSVCSADGRIGAIRFANPFDLGPVLFEQAERRRRWLIGAIC